MIIIGAKKPFISNKLKRLGNKEQKLNACIVKNGDLRFGI